MSDMKIGMIGLDTSHCPTFARILNKRRSKTPVTYAYKGGTKAFSHSINRVDKFTKQLRKKYDVNMLKSIEDVADKSDAILLTSVDGRQHLEQFEILSKYQKPVYIDKPLACSLEDAKKIIHLSEKTKTPMFSCSSLRYYNGIYQIGKDKDIKIAEVYGKVPIMEDYPGYFWYGVHSAEILFSILGAGCEQLQVASYENFDLVTANWSGERIGLLYGMRYKTSADWSVKLFSDDGVIDSIAKNKPSGFELMVPHILDFFKSKKSPINNQEMLEIMAYLEAVNKSRENGEAIQILV
ncbi:MAG: hypothetical protein GF364_11100 [Candidatus Lokiarchaeota archaeon]|nr:hypothetical protein [Candidatus Lokiarchaeota archaeon]